MYTRWLCLCYHYSIIVIGVVVRGCVKCPKDETSTKTLMARQFVNPSSSPYGASRNF